MKITDEKDPVELTAGSFYVFPNDFNEKTSVFIHYFLPSEKFTVKYEENAILIKRGIC